MNTKNNSFSSFLSEFLINLALKFSSYEDNNLTKKESPSIKSKSESLNQIKSKPLSNYEDQLTFDSFQSTKNISSDLNKSQSQGEEDTFFSLKHYSFGSETSYSIKSSNNIINKFIIDIILEYNFVFYNLFSYYNYGININKYITIIFALEISD